MRKNNLTPALFLLIIMLAALTSCGNKQNNTTGNLKDSTGKTENKKEQVQKESGKPETDQPKGLDTFLTAGYMYWVPPAILDAHWAAVITGEVVNIEKRRIGATDPNKNEVFGMIKIDKVLYSEPTVSSDMKNEKYVRTDGLKGFKQGDKVMVYFTTYKNNYAIKRDNVKKLRSDDDELLGLTERYIANSQDSMKILTDPKEYKMWGKYDVGTASRMMQAYEEQMKGR